MLETFLASLVLPFTAHAAAEEDSEEHAEPASGSGTSDPKTSEKASSDAARPARAPAMRTAMAAFAAAAPAAGDGKSEATASSLSLPQGAGQVSGLGESFQALLSTGGLSFGIPLVMPEARGLAQPSLSLQYATGGGNGVVGLGWNLGVPNVARKTDRGNPSYADPQGAWTPASDRFVFNGADLVPICTVAGSACEGALAGEVMPRWADKWAYFRLLKEGSFQRFFWSPDHRTWRVQDKTGLAIELGVPLDGSSDDNALETDPANVQRIFRWNAARAYDANGAGDPLGDAQPKPYNVVRYRYLHDGGFAYPSDLYATPPADGSTTFALGSFAHHVHLRWETRPDAVTMYRRGWSTRQALRLAGVDVTSKPWVTTAAAARRTVRRYHLAYEAGTLPSFLSSVTMEGRCGGDELASTAEGSDGTLPATDCPRLPPVRFTYTQSAGTGARSAEGFEPLARRVKAIANSPQEALDQGQTTFFDWNADGLPDVLVADASAFRGAHGVYLSASSGTRDSFGAASLVGIRPVNAAPVLDAYALSLRTPSVLAMDVDGDGLVDLAHLPKGRATTLYAPSLTVAGQPFWKERIPSSDASHANTIDLTSRDPDVRVADVNGDGLVDVVRTTGLEIQTYLSLGYLPGGDGMFGHGALTSATTATLSPDPLRTCTPSFGGAPRFQSPNVKLVDVNGDGLLDILQISRGSAVYWPGRGDGRWGATLPADCAAGQRVEGAHIVLTGAPNYATDAGSLLMGDVNGDGFADVLEVLSDSVTVWLNRNGEGYAAPQTLLAPIRNASPARVRLADVNGTGSADIVWGESKNYQYLDVTGGARPGLLATVDNGLGALREFTYATTVDEMLDASAKGTPWTSRVPSVVHVLKRAVVRDRLEKVGRPAGAVATEYTYRDPYYDARERSFRGFRSAITRELGDASNPTSVTETTFLLGECSEDGVAGRCTPAGRFYENPRDALAGSVRSVERRDEAGVVRSTAHPTYTLRTIYRGLDGRDVHQSFESESNEWVYDTASFDRVAGSVTTDDVVVEGADGTATRSTGTLTLPATRGRARLRRTGTVDAFGNATSMTELGCIEGCEKVDEALGTKTTFDRAPGESSGWLWRATGSFIEGTSRPGERRKEQSVTYDALGRVVGTASVLKGSLALDRFHEMPGAAIAPAPPSASIDGVLVTGAFEYDAYGQRTFERRANGQCRKLVFDPAYDELLATELGYAGALGANGCGTQVFGATGQYDRGLHEVLVRTGVNGEDARVSLDGFGRVREVYAPDADHVGQPSPLPSARYEYTLPADPTVNPYTVVRTLVFDGKTPSDASYRESWSFRDGTGRPLATLSQADRDAGDGGAWVVAGLTRFDAKGKANQLFAPFFSDTLPNVFALGMTPPSAFESERIDAFGRVTDRFALDGTRTSHLDYHAQSIDTWDAEDLREGGPHQGTFATAYLDGHGRPSREIERYRENGALLQRETRSDFLPTGEAVTVTRASGKAGDAPVVRWMQYDTLGRRVLNVEPNASRGSFASGSADAVKAYRYAYDDAGREVGWSDARGCGANLFYDAGGRAIGEDLSPCTAEHAAYSAPNLTTGEGLETYTTYDALASEEQEALAEAGCSVRGDTLRGRAVRVASRGDVAVSSVDGRGRPVCLARRIARPTAGYAARWYVQSAQFDGADRPIATTTGARSPELLGTDGQSRIDLTYGRHGGLVTASGSYGSLYARLERDADGLTRRRVYGDGAATETSLGYDARRRLVTAKTSRSAPSLWSAAGYPASTGSRRTQQLVLEDAELRYDLGGSPLELLDHRDATAWPDSAKPVSRTVSYDDFYRTSRVSYSYASGADTWQSPVEAEETTTDPSRPLASPHGVFPTRVKEETFAFDGLGNLVKSGDDLAGFYDRSLGTIAHGSAADGPYQLRRAELAGNRGGSLDASYDAAGNLRALVVQRSGACAPVGASCNQRFLYDWDEVSRLARARRWDLRPGAEQRDAQLLANDPPGREPDAELRYLYDGEDNRVVKTARDERHIERHTVYVFGSLELRRAEWLPEEDDYRLSAATETPYLFVGGARVARVVYGSDSLPTQSRGRQHVFLELGDHLGSTSTVIDRETGELVERATHTAFGQRESDYRPERWESFREDYGFTGKEEDLEVGLQYFGKRYYAPALMQWTSPDPLAVHSLTGDANVYAYVQGKSLATVDPDGRCELICLIIVGAVVGAAFNAASTFLAGGAVTWATLYVGAVGGALAPVGGAALGPVIAPAFAFLGPMAPMVAAGAGAGLTTAMGTGGAEEAVRPGATPGGVLKGMFDPMRLAFGAAMGAALAGLTYAGTEALRGAQQAAPKQGAAPNATPTAPPATGGPGSAPVTPSVQPYEAPELSALRAEGHALPKLEVPQVRTPGPAPKPPTPAWARPLKVEISRGPEGQVSATFSTEEAVPQSTGATAQPKLLGQPIRWEPKDLARVISKHGPDLSGKGGAFKSRFNPGENIAALIEGGTHQQAVAQAGSRNLIRTFDMGRIIGTDVTTGAPTSIMNIVTSPSGRLVTAYPGTP